MKKFELTNESEIWEKCTLYRIRALISFGKVAEGEIGGWVERESNLSQDGNAWVTGNARLTDNAQLQKNDDYMTISPIGSSNGTFTAYRTKDGSIECTRGCFVGSVDEFEEAVAKTHGENEYAKQYQAVIALVRLRLLINESIERRR